MRDGEDNSEHEVAVMTTLHYVIQTQRMGTISESSGRAAMFLTAVSMALVALGFIAQATRLDNAFYAFAFGLITVLVMIGGSTFLRLVELGAEDAACAVANERIKAFYIDAAPRTARWMIDPPARTAKLGTQAVRVRLPFQMLMTASSMVAMVNGALLGAGAALALRQSGIASAVLAGAAVFVVAVVGQLMVTRRIWLKAQRRIADSGDQGD